MRGWFLRFQTFLMLRVKSETTLLKHCVSCEFITIHKKVINATKFDLRSLLRVKIDFWSSRLFYFEYFNFQSSVSFKMNCVKPSPAARKEPRLCYRAPAVSFRCSVFSIRNFPFFRSPSVVWNPFRLHRSISKMSRFILRASEYRSDVFLHVSIRHPRELLTSDIHKFMSWLFPPPPSCQHRSIRVIFSSQIIQTFLNTMKAAW